MSTISARQPKRIHVGGQFVPDTRPEDCPVLCTTGQTISDLIDVTSDTLQVLDELRAAGGCPLIVGGAVRDGLLARAQEGAVASMDVDIEVTGSPSKR